MEEKENIIDKLIKKIMMNEPKVDHEINVGRITLSFMSNGSVFYSLNNEKINWFYSKARVKDLRTIDTRTAKIKDISTQMECGKTLIMAVYEENGLKLIQHFEIDQNTPYFIIQVEIIDQRKETETNYIAPLDFAYPSKNGNHLFLSLDQKMLIVPYDNDMWVRYESLPLKPGRESYDVTAIYDENNNHGLLLGALDFSDWKNAIICSEVDARCYTAFSGAADYGTHDFLPHGTLIGSTVNSSRFICGFYDDIRDGLEEYGKLAMYDKKRLSRMNVVPFGWNSYSALALSSHLLDHLDETSKFISEELPNFKDKTGSSFINLDANFGLPEKRMKEVIASIIKRGQKPGSYMAPLCVPPFMNLFPLKGTLSKTMKDIVLKLPDGHPYPAIDGSVPIDITFPWAEKYIRLTIRELIDQGFDFIKIDFLGHGSVEGARYDKSVRTGRQALKRFYDILNEEIDPAKTKRPIFIDLSIAPLFPAGFGNGRRASCDAFGHHEDVRYVLNALNYAWWTNGTLYDFNDPDHTVLFESSVDQRGVIDFNSARSRYNASIISGTILLLSDNFGPYGNETKIREAKERVKAIANNEELNSVARYGVAFRPAYIKSDTANIYYQNINDHHFIAIFNFNRDNARISVYPLQFKMPEVGIYRDLNMGIEFPYSKEISIELEGFDSRIIEVK